MFQVCLLIPIPITIRKNLQQRYLLTGPIIVTPETGQNNEFDDFDDESYINNHYIEDIDL